MAFLQQWSDSNAFFIWLRESPSIWAYPTVFYVHTIGLIFTAGASIIINTRALGAWRQIPLAALTRCFRPVWIGVWLTAISGAIMLLSDLTRLGNRLFPVKMTLVAAAVVLTVVMRRRIARSNESAATRACAAASLACWLGAIAAGRFMAYFQ